MNNTTLNSDSFSSISNDISKLLADAESLQNRVELLTATATAQPEETQADTQLEYMDMTALLDLAVGRIVALPPGSIFKLNQLLYDDDWGAFPREDRSLFGKFFKGLVEIDRITGVTFRHTNQSNHSVYEKTDE